VTGSQAYFLLVDLHAHFADEFAENRAGAGAVSLMVSAQRRTRPRYSSDDARNESRISGPFSRLRACLEPARLGFGSG
jgi:hypothetical protein